MEFLEGIKIQKPKTMLYMTSAQNFVSDPAQIRKNLADQMVKPVKFWSGLLNIIRSGYKRFVDVGCGRVLKGFLEKSPAEVLDKDKILEKD